MTKTMFMRIVSHLVVVWPGLLDLKLFHPLFNTYALVGLSQLVSGQQPSTASFPEFAEPRK